ncbi:MAG: GDYXXLXY domain-containing protein, partial [Planctomycetaceae bacterium]
AAVVFQVLVLMALIAEGARPWVTGETIRLRVIPVDPRDLFRGDYLILSYDFTTQSPPHMRRHDSSRIGREIFVSLVRDEDGQHWRTAFVSWTRPPAGIYLRGEVDQHRRNDCGIGQFFLQEGHGKKYEQLIRQHRLSAEVAVTADGRAALKRLIIADD